MNVAPYALFYVGCHFHGLIEGRCQAKGVRSAAGAPTLIPHSRG